MSRGWKHPWKHPWSNHDPCEQMSRYAGHVREKMIHTYCRLARTTGYTGVLSTTWVYQVYSAASSEYTNLNLLVFYC